MTSDAAEHRHTAVLHGDVVDQLHDDDGLADAGAAEEANLAALQVRLEQVDDLDAGLEHAQLRGLLFERRCGTMNRPALLRLDRPIRVVHRLAEHVEDAAERLGPHGHRDRGAGIDRGHATRHAVGRLHRHRAHTILAEVLLDLADDVDLLDARSALGDDADGVVDVRQSLGEFNVDDWPDDLDHLAGSWCCCCLCHNWILEGLSVVLLLGPGPSPLGLRSPLPPKPPR